MLSGNDELIYMGVKKGGNTIKNIAKITGKDRLSVRTYLRRLIDRKLIRQSLCVTCHQTNTYFVN